MLAGLVLACTPAPPGALRLSVQWAAAPAAGADSLANLQLTATDRPVPDARLTIQAFMTHPGMAPVEAAVEEQGDGRYRARVRFTMAGDWVLRVQGTTADGRPIDLQEEVRGVRPVQ